MKLGIAGAGMIVVQGLLEFVHDIEGIELLGICATKRSEEKLKKLSEEHGIAHTYTDYEEMLKSVEVYSQITYEPLCPGTFPFGQKTECPLYRPEDGQHPQQDLLDRKSVV